MEKLSLFDILSFILPGAIATVLLWYLSAYYFPVDLSKLNSEFSSILFIAVSFFLGSVIHYSFDLKPVSSLLKKMGLYECVSSIYRLRLKESYVKDYYQPMLKRFESLGYKTEDEQLEEVWSIIYYKLEAENKINTPKSYQSFYFFFRNTAILCILTLIGSFIVLIFSLGGCSDSVTVSETLLFIFLGAVVLLLSIVGGKMHRRKMVLKMFWTYFSLYNKPF